MLSLWATRAQSHWGTLDDNVEQTTELSAPYPTSKGQGYWGVYFPFNALNLLWNSVCQGDIVWALIASYTELTFCYTSFFLFRPNSKWSCKRVSHSVHFITHICAQASLTTHIGLILLNRHIIIFGFECYLILKDFLQDLTFTIHNKYPKSSQTFHISHFPCRETLILNCFIDS